MKRFRTTLVSGSKPPYTSWTFLIIPAGLAAQWGPGQIPVQGSISGTTFRGTASRGEGQLRIPIPRELRERAGVAMGDTVDVAIELDPNPRPLSVPEELRAVFRDHPEVARLYDQLPPSLRRAWAAYVDEAKRPETRNRRARKAPHGIRVREFPR
jgi:bifunctional DNA-binding transcriptional regulator/antitoxin component of YhaV-PrlF toxin-antitoxin module